MLDSGTTYIYLPSAAFQAFTAEVERQALENGLYKVDPPSSQVGVSTALRDELHAIPNRPQSQQNSWLVLDESCVR